MTRWEKHRVWDEMVQTYIREGQELAGGGDRVAAERRFHTACEVLVRSYQAPVIGFCVNMLRGRSDNAHDIAQQVFVACWQQMLHFRHEARIRNWLFAIARHKCLDAIADLEPNETLDDDEQDVELESFSSNLGPGASLALEQRDWLNRGLAKLSPGDREILIMSFVTELDPDEIASSLNLTQEGVRTRRKRALDRLRKVINDEREGPQTSLG